MTPTPNLTTERVDDVPLLLHLLTDKLGVHEVLDELWPRHGNWQGLSAGQVTVTWLTHILSEHSHVMSHVQAWANHLPQTLAHLLGQPVSPTDLADDRLAAVLEILSQETLWPPLEQRVGQRMLRVYQLPKQRVRLDSTTAKVYGDDELAVLFQRGHSKDHRPDLRQLKLMLAALDPLGALVAVDVVPGNRADDGLYVPIIQRVRETVQAHDLLYLGDCKMGALATRAYVHGTQNDYLMPMALVGTAAMDMAAWVQAAVEGHVTLQPIYDDDGTTLLGEGYELSRAQVGPGPVGTRLHWQERVFVLRSARGAATAQRGLQQRLRAAQTALEALTPTPRQGVTPCSDPASLAEPCAQLVARYAVEGLLQWRIEPVTERRAIRAYRDRPARVEERTYYRLHAQPDAAAVAQRVRVLGWHAYLTNAGREDLTLAQGVQAYRDEWLIERNCQRLKGRPLSLAPLWVTREDHAVGLVRLLSLAARVLALAEYQVRRKLKVHQRLLVGLYPEQPKRATDQPTTERLLKAFKPITLTLMPLGDQVLAHITPLSELQQHVLRLLDCPPDLYTRLVAVDSS